MGGLVDIPLSRLTVTRTGTATRVNASGLIETVSANTARIDYDPVTLACRGLLCEESRTNLLSYSRQFDGAGWAVESLVTPTPNASLSPDGATNAYKLIAASGTGTHSLFRASSVSFTSGDTLCFPIFAKAAELTKFRLNCTTGGNGFQSTFDLSAGTASGASVGTGTLTLADIKQYPNGWYRCIVIGRLPGASTSVNPRIQLLDAGGNLSFAGDGSSGIYIDYSQFEIGAFATSPVVTTTTTASRAADFITVATSGIPGWNASAGSICVEATTFSTVASAAPVLVHLDDGTTTNRIMATFGDGSTTLNHSRLLVDVSSVSQASIGATLASASAVNRVAVAWASNSFAIVANGGSATTDTSGSVPAVSTLRIGGRSIGTPLSLNGYIRRLQYFPRRLSNADLQALTV
ncbi:hypothetical protein ACJ41P_10640 [Azospirillum argentinense]|uniref:Concanavalin A-like lectin/glucanase superfamily protein n=1 Tax=Azospirillum argentinense TaxID=2970906 RepID=A0ABW8V5D8_9PROT